MKYSASHRTRKISLYTAIAVFLTTGAFLLSGAFAKPMELYERKIISGSLNDVWRIATDVDHWAEWDPHEEAGEIYGPFEKGTRAYSKPLGGPGAHWVLTEVTENKSWALLNKMPIGALRVENRYTNQADGQVLCEKTMVVSGWLLKLLFKLHFESETRKDMQATWVALEERVAVEGKASVEPTLRGLVN